MLKAFFIIMNLVKKAINAFKEIIKAIEQGDFETFLTYISPRILDMVDRNSFQKAIELHKRQPLSVKLLDKKKSEVISKMPIKVKLMMKNGRRLTTFISTGEKWVADTIFWA